MTAAGAVLAAVTLVCGLILLRQRVAVPAGALLVAGALVGVAGLWLLGRPGSGGTVLTSVGGMVLPALAAWAYPRPRRRHPVDLLLVVLLVLPGLATARWGEEPGVFGSTAFVTACVLAAQIWWRLEQGPEEERRALVWLALAIGVGGVWTLVVFVADADPWSLVAGLLVATLVPVTMVVGAVRPELVDVRGIVVLGVVGVVLAVGYVAMFVGTASAARALGAGVPTVPVLALLGMVGAVAWHPSSVVLRGVVDRMLFGDRPDPLDAARAMARGIGDDPAAALDVVRDALRLPWAALRVDGEVTVSSGTAVTATRDVPLGWGDATLQVGLRPGDLRLGPGDEDVLHLVAPLLGQVLRVRALAADVAASRAGTVAAVEEERRRLRQDLHDGVGPTLTGLAFSVDAARNQLSDTEAADALLRAIRADAGELIGEVRRLVYGLRPPALDELGLGPALRQRAGYLRRADGTPLPVEVTGDDVLPALPAAVEVAVYRVVLEALTNVVRHVPGGSARVVFGVSAELLEVCVTDDGPGRSAWRAGVGVESMRDRAAEVGGRVEWGPGPAGGIVRLSVPLADPPAAGRLPAAPGATPGTPPGTSRS